LLILTEDKLIIGTVFDDYVTDCPLQY